MLTAALQTWLGGALLWVVLHSADFVLTLAGARLRKLRAAEVIDSSGSYELNPVFQKVVDEGRWWSRRFIVSLFAGAAAFASLNLLAPLQPDPLIPLVRDGLLGGVLFTRIAIIGRHVQNIWMFRRMANDPDAVTGHIRYDRTTVLLISAFQFGTVSALVSVSALIAPSPFLIGGAFFCGLLTVLHLVLAWRYRARSAPSVAL